MGKRAMFLPRKWEHCWWDYFSVWSHVSFLFHLPCRFCICSVVKKKVIEQMNFCPGLDCGWPAREIITVQMAPTAYWCKYLNGRYSLGTSIISCTELFSYKLLFSSGCPPYLPFAQFHGTWKAAGRHLSVFMYAKQAKYLTSLYPEKVKEEITSKETACFIDKYFYWEILINLSKQHWMSPAFKNSVFAGGMVVFFFLALSSHFWCTFF